MDKWSLILSSRHSRLRCGEQRLSRSTFHLQKEAGVKPNNKTTPQQLMKVCSASATCKPVCVKVRHTHLGSCIPWPPWTCRCWKWAQWGSASADPRCTAACSCIQPSRPQRPPAKQGRLDWLIIDYPFVRFFFSGLMNRQMYASMDINTMWGSHHYMAMRCLVSAVSVAHFHFCLAEFSYRANDSLGWGDFGPE